MSIRQKKSLPLVLGPMGALLIAYAMLMTGAEQTAAVTLAVAFLCVAWWIFEPIPIPATSLLPLALLPMFGVLTKEEVGQAYGHDLVLLLLGGFILSTAMERSGAHRRIAISMVRAFGGTSSRRLVFGFMAASALLSMWISNTATTLMLLPVALAVLERAKDPQLPAPLLLGIAYAANIGGIGTPIGTPPNIVFMSVYEETVGQSISFSTWMGWGVPVVLIFLPIMGLWLTRTLTYQGTTELPEVGEWRPEERRVLTVFVLTALAWITRREPMGGWSELFGLPFTNDAMVALIAVIAMFIIPNGKGGRLLDWETANRIPWGMLILFGAGLTIATAFKSSGLSESIGSTVAQISMWHPLGIILTICIVVTFLTETTSNTATTSLLMPILAAAALGAAIDPKLFMIPAAMSASCAFMLPVATAPNVIMFSTGRFTGQRMIREGLALNFIGAIIIATMCFAFLV
jgi:sodium-dependent dicarboxylate transporter 2/3/5